MIGPTSLSDVYVVGALAGFGTMSACATGELCAATILGESLPSYAAYFHPDRAEDTAIQEELKKWSNDGQL